MKNTLDDLYRNSLLRTFNDAADGELSLRESAASWSNRRRASQGGYLVRLSESTDTFAASQQPVANPHAVMHSRSADKLDTTAEWVTEQRSIVERKMSLNNALEELLDLEEDDSESATQATRSIAGRPSSVAAVSVPVRRSSTSCRTMAWTEETEVTSKPVIIENE